MKKKSMNIKRECKKLLMGFLCMMLLASNAVSALAESTDTGVPAVSGNDVSGNSIECGHEYHYMPGNDRTHIFTCINCGLEDAEDCIFTKKEEGLQVCEKCGFVEKAEEMEETLETEDEEAENEEQFLSLESGSYDISAADRIYAAGENITAYYFETEGTLVFEGTGEMFDWTDAADSPWDTDTIVTAIIGEGITTLGDNALCRHEELADVILPGTLKEIGDYAVMVGYPIYSSVRGVLRHIEIPEGVERIGENAFQGNALEEIIIPDSVTDIGEYAFAECRNAENISIGSGISEIKERTFEEIYGVKTITIPGNVETIRKMAFRKTGAVEIIISDGVKTIEREAFESCKNAESITLGNSVEVIGSRSFFECIKLKSLIIPDSVVTIESSAFESCNSLSDLVLGSGLLTILNHAFDGAHVLERLEIPDNVTQIASSAFYDSRALKDISIGKGVTRFGAKVFFVEDMTQTNVETDNKNAINYEWADDGREVTFRSKVIFKDHAGNSIRELVLEHGETILDKALVMGEYEDGGDTYVFTGWEPEITGDTKVTGGAEYTPKYSIPGKGTVTFKNYNGTVLKEVLLSYGETILDKAPPAFREAEGRNTYMFSGWFPALNETDELTGDAVYTAKYKRKVQTSIQVSYDNNIPEGSSISDTNIIVYPVYKVYDENGKLIDLIQDDEAVIGEDDIRFSKDRIERGSNEVVVEQISTGLTTTAEIFGSYIDGIAVWKPPVEMEAGTELKELEVYFTRTIEDKAGYIENGLIDFTKEVEEYELNGEDSVTIEEGENEIRVTEKETGDEHECTVHIKGIPKPSDGKDDVSGNNPSDGKDDVSGNNPPGGKDDVSENNPSNDKKDDVSGKEDTSENNKKPGKEDIGKDSSNSIKINNNTNNTGDSFNVILPDAEMEHKEKEMEPVIQTGRVSPVYGFAVLGVCSILFIGAACLFEKRKRAEKSL